jgi:hypothetical protein
VTPRLSGVFVLYVNGVLSRASSKPSQISCRFSAPPTPDTSRVSLARTLPAVWKKCAVHVRHPERSKRRAVHRREPLVPRDAPGVFLPRHAHIPIPTNMVVASAVVAPCAVPARLGARKSYGAAAVRPASGATRVVPRRGAGACPPDLRGPAAATPRGCRARCSLRYPPRPGEGAPNPRGPTRAAGRPATAQIRRSSSAISAIWTRAESVRAHRRLRPRTAFLFSRSLSNDTYPHVF